MRCVFNSRSLPLQFPFNSPSIPLQEPFEVEDEHGTDLSMSTRNIGRRQRVKALREGATKVHDTPLAAVLYCCAPLLLATERTSLSTPTLVFFFSRHFRSELSSSCSPLFPLSSRPHTRSHTPRTHTHSTALLHCLHVSLTHAHIHIQRPGPGRPPMAPDDLKPKSLRRRARRLEKAALARVTGGQDLLQFRQDLLALLDNPTGQRLLSSVCANLTVAVDSGKVV
jgi:hypothetical protein